MSIEFGHKISQEEARDLRNTDVILFNSEKDIKRLGSLGVLHSFARGNHASSIIQLEGALDRIIKCNETDAYNEPVFHTALESANHKALFLDKFYPDFMTSGADSIHMVFNQTKNEWETHHKQGRNGEELSDINTELKKRYVYPESGKLFLAWDLSVTFINGEEHHFPEKLIVKTKTLDLELFESYFKNAKKTGLINKASTGIALIEAVFENDPSAEIGFFTPSLMEEHGSDIWKQLISVSEYRKQLAIFSVLSTMPGGHFLREDLGDVFEAMHQVAKKNNIIKPSETSSI